MCYFCPIYWLPKTHFVRLPCPQTQISKEEENDESGENVFNPLNASLSSATNRKVSKVAGRLGFDFVLYMLKLVGRRYRTGYVSEHDDVMSSTGFVTFLDLRTVTNVASTPLTHKPKVCCFFIQCMYHHFFIC